MYADPAWLTAGEVDMEAFEQVSNHWRSYTGGPIFTATELRELADSLVYNTPETVKSALLDTSASYRGLLCEDCYQELISECTWKATPKLTVSDLPATEVGSSARRTSLMLGLVLLLSTQAGGKSCSVEVVL